MSIHYRQTWLEINLDTIWHNYQSMQAYAENQILIPVIKANAYGHGSLKVCQHLYEKGITFFAVSLLEEALELRYHMKNIDILIMGAVLYEHFDLISKNNLICTLYDEQIIDAAMSYQKELRCHVKIDTGMHRYGIKVTEHFNDIIYKLGHHQFIKLEGIYSHFATASERDNNTLKQWGYFNQTIKPILDKPPVLHISNSSGIHFFSTMIKDVTHARLGISLYGLSLDHPYPSHIYQAMTLKSKVIQIKHLKKGDGLGYGLTYCASTDEVIALIPIGYADGFIRRNKHGYVEIKQKRYQIVGNVCMDTTFIKVDSDIKKGDEVILFGSSLVTIDEVADRLGTINYEVITNVTQRVPRIYIKDGKTYD